MTEARAEREGTGAAGERRLTLLCMADVHTDDPLGHLPWDVYYQRANARATEAYERAERYRRCLEVIIERAPGPPRTFARVQARRALGLPPYPHRGP